MDMTPLQNTVEYASGDPEFRSFMEKKYTEQSNDADRQEMVTHLTGFQHVENDPEYRFSHSTEYDQMDKAARDKARTTLQGLPTLGDKNDFANEFTYQRPNWFTRNIQNLGSYMPGAVVTPTGTPQTITQKDASGAPDTQQLLETGKQQAITTAEMIPYMLAPEVAPALGITNPFAAAAATGLTNVGIQGVTHALDKNAPEVGVNVPTAVNALGPIGTEVGGRFLSAPATEAVETAERQTKTNARHLGTMTKDMIEARKLYDAERAAVTARVRNVPSAQQELELLQAEKRFKDSLAGIKEKYTQTATGVGEAEPVIPKAEYTSAKSLGKIAGGSAAVAHFVPQIMPYIPAAIPQIAGIAGGTYVAAKVAQRAVSQMLLEPAGRATLAKISKGIPISQIEHGLLNTAAQSAYKDVSAEKPKE